MSTTPAPSPNSMAGIGRAAEHAYAVVGKELGVDPGEVHRMRVCHRVAELMVGSLIETEPGVQRETRGGWTVDEHSYLDVRPNGDLIADGTWQQFVNQDKLSPDAPKVLVGSREAVIGTLRSHGVDELTLALWEKTG